MVRSGGAPKVAPGRLQRGHGVARRAGVAPAVVGHRAGPGAPPHVGGCSQVTHNWCSLATLLPTLPPTVGFNFQAKVAKEPFMSSQKSWAGRRLYPGQLKGRLPGDPASRGFSFWVLGVFPSPLTTGWSEGAGQRSGKRGPQPQGASTALPAVPMEGPSGLGGGAKPGGASQEGCSWARLSRVLLTPTWVWRRRRSVSCGPRGPSSLHGSGTPARSAVRAAHACDGTLRLRGACLPLSPPPGLACKGRRGPVATPPGARCTVLPPPH